MINEYEILQDLGSKVLIATLCGLIIGWERELKSKVAGIRTNVLVCAGSAIFTAISIYIYDSNVQIANEISANPNSDPSRIIGQIVTGIGFLGAGVIYKNGNKVVGITTASFIWMMAAIGVLVGIGLILTPIILTIGLLFITLSFHVLEKKIKPEKNGRNKNDDEQEV